MILLHGWLTSSERMVPWLVTAVGMLNSRLMVSTCWWTLLSMCILRLVCLAIGLGSPFGLGIYSGPS